MRSETPGAARASWDYVLMMSTVAALSALGVQSFLGTLYAWWGERSHPAWSTVGYPAFVETMNAIAAPIVVALVVLLGLCIPRRLLARRALALVSFGMLAVGAVAWVASGDPVVGLAAYLVAAGAFQLVVLGLTLAGARYLDYLTEGRLVRIGSGLLHLGFVVFAYVVVVLQDSPWMLPVFWLSAGLTIAGTVLSFYARPIRGRAGRARLGSEGPTAP